MKFNSCYGSSKIALARCLLGIRQTTLWNYNNHGNLIFYLKLIQMKKTCNNCKALIMGNGMTCYCELKYAMCPFDIKPLEDCPKPLTIGKLVTLKNKCSDFKRVENCAHENYSYTLNNNTKLCDDCGSEFE